jgi:hypothetical protein
MPEDIVSLVEIVNGSCFHVFKVICRNQSQTQAYEDSIIDGEELHFDDVEACKRTLPM